MFHSFGPQLKNMWHSENINVVITQWNIILSFTYDFSLCFHDNKFYFINCCLIETWGKNENILQKVLNCKKVCSLQFTYLATRLHPELCYHGDHTKLEITMDTNKYVKAIYTSDVFQSIMEYIPVSN